MAIDQNNPEYQKKDLKRGVDYIGVNVVFCCHDKDGKVLMQKRSRNCRDEQGTWDFGGGSMEFGETFEEAVGREVMEEYGVLPLEVKYIITKNVLREHDGKPTHWIKNMYWVLVDPEKVRVGDSEKMDEIGWFMLDNLPEPLHSQILPEVEIMNKFFANP
jgi:8-oxo-dGTP diphosphatase